MIQGEIQRKIRRTFSRGPTGVPGGLLMVFRNTTKMTKNIGIRDPCVYSNTIVGFSCVVSLKTKGEVTGKTGYSHDFWLRPPGAHTGKAVANRDPWHSQFPRSEIIFPGEYPRHSAVSHVRPGFTPRYPRSSFASHSLPVLPAGIATLVRCIARSARVFCRNPYGHPRGKREDTGTYDDLLQNPPASAVFGANQHGKPRSPADVRESCLNLNRHSHHPDLSHGSPRFSAELPQTPTDCAPILTSTINLSLPTTASTVSRENPAGALKFSVVLNGYMRESLLSAIPQGLRRFDGGE